MSAGTAPVVIPDTTIHGFLAACEGLGWKVRHNVSCREIEISFDGKWRVLSEKHLLSRIVDTLALRCHVLNKDGTARVAKFNRQSVEQHLETVSECDRYDELGAWLESLPDWDGEDRISRLFRDMFDAEETELNRWAANAVFWQVVDRIEKCQHGNRGESHRATVIFAGPQTVGKTAFVRELLPPHLRPRYLVEGLNFRMGRDELLRICSGRLLVEVGEFGVGADLEDTKAFITAARDNVNHKYQRPYTTPRSFVMLGGFNPEQDNPLARDLSGKHPVRRGGAQQEVRRRSRVHEPGARPALGAGMAPVPRASRPLPVGSRSARRRSEASQPAARVHQRGAGRSGVPCLWVELRRRA